MAILDQTADGLAAAVSAPAAGPIAADDGGERASWFQVGPLVVVLALFFGLPMLVVLAVSFFDFDRSDIIPAFIFDNYVELFRSEVTLRLYTSSIKFALIVWAVTFVLGFNVAYFLVFHVRGTLWQIALFLLCTVPFLTSNIIRMISWIPFLGRNGIFNQALVGSGAVQQAPGVPAVLRLRRDRGLRPPVHAVHGGADLQFDGAHRQKPARGGARRRRQPLPGGVRDRAAAFARAASRWARSS